MGAVSGMDRRREPSGSLFFGFGQLDDLEKSDKRTDGTPFSWMGFWGSYLGLVGLPFQSLVGKLIYARASKSDGSIALAPAPQRCLMDPATLSSPVLAMDSGPTRSLLLRSCQSLSLLKGVGNPSFGVMLWTIFYLRSLIQNKN